MIRGGNCVVCGKYVEECCCDGTDIIFYFQDDKFQIALTLSNLLLKNEFAYILNDIMRGGKFISAEKEEVEDFLKIMWDCNED